MLKIGDLLGGKYRILSVVGRGGMSTVYLARNERANKNWAVKEVRKSGVNQDQVVEQSLLTEVEIMKHLNNPHLPSIIDVIDIDDTFVIVMDFVEGNSLEKVLEHGSVSEIQVIDLAKQLCDVLLYLHSCNPPIIYRDMKPANIVLRPDGVVMLVRRKNINMMNREMQPLVLVQEDMQHRNSMEDMEERMPGQIFTALEQLFIIW